MRVYSGDFSGRAVVKMQDIVLQHAQYFPLSQWTRFDFFIHNSIDIK
jgi:hypothetical protein